MAPGAGKTLPTGNSFATNDQLPPPSTIAAQIVHSRANPTARQEPENQALFSKLLQEYLRDPVAEQIDLETNAQLISVVAEAGLDSRSSTGANRDPFAPDTAAQQTVDSLRVIQLTVQRSPDVLILPRGAEEAGDESKPPLVLWLLPKVLRLLAGGEEIRRQAISLINAALSSCLKTPHLWKRGLELHSLCKRIVDGKRILGAEYFSGYGY
jgi:serine/threonine-protein kinase ATR